MSRLFLSCISIAMVCSAAVFAESISGKVLDPKGSPIPGVRLFLLQSNKVVSRGVSDETGRYSFAQLAPGTYSLSVHELGFRQERNEFHLEPGQELQRDLGLGLESLREHAVVTATRTETPASLLGNSVTVITPEDIQAQNAITVSEVLRNVLGINIVQVGGTGSITSIFLRGGVWSRGPGGIRKKTRFRIRRHVGAQDLRALATEALLLAVLATSDAPSVFPLGTTLVTFRATDASGNSSTATTTVTVVDTTPPVIQSATPNPVVLWPPNHKMVPVTVTVSASDICDAAPTCRIVSVTSNEPVNGLGDGDMAPVKGALASRSWPLYCFSALIRHHAPFALWCGTPRGNQLHGPRLSVTGSSIRSAGRLQLTEIFKRALST